MKYGYACIDSSALDERHGDFPYHRELLHAGVKAEHIIIEDRNTRHRDLPARRLLLQRLKAGDELVCYSQCDLGVDSEQRWACLNDLAKRQVTVRMLHMTYDADPASSHTFSSFRDAVSAGRLALHSCQG